MTVLHPSRYSSSVPKAKTVLFKSLRLCDFVKLSEKSPLLIHLKYIRNMAILLRIVLINLFVIQVSTENISPNSTNIQFQRNSDFDGKICDGDHVVFSEENLKKSVCLAGCASNVNCKSVFHVQDNGACIGCTNRYNSVTNPAGLSENSLYYVTVGKGLFFFIQ
jgi:hypothetical protein